MSKNYECLIVVFRPELTLAVSNRSSLHTLQLSCCEYRDSKNLPWNCFYDWLRNAENQIIGVRYSVWSYLSNLFDELTKYSYVGVGKEKKSIEIYFSEHHQFLDALSQDQEFYENRILLSKDNEYAMTFGIRFLQDVDIENIMSAHARWETPLWSE